MKNTFAILLILLVSLLFLLPQGALAFLGIDFGGIGDIFSGIGNVFSGITSGFGNVLSDLGLPSWVSEVGKVALPQATKLLPTEWQETIGTATSVFNVAQTGWGVAGKVYDSFSGEAGYDFYNPPSTDTFYNSFTETEDIYSPYYSPPGEYDFYNPPSEDVIGNTWDEIGKIPGLEDAFPTGYDFYNPPSEDVIKNTWDKLAENPELKVILSGIMPSAVEDNVWKDIINVPGVSKTLGDVISGKTSKDTGLADIFAIKEVKDKLNWNIPGLEGKTYAEILSDPVLTNKLLSAGFPQSALDNLKQGLKSASVSQIEIKSPIEAKTFRELIAAILEFLKILAIAISPIMVIVAGFHFITAAGDPAKITTAKKIILYTLIGLAIVLLADALVDFLETVVKG